MRKHIFKAKKICDGKWVSGYLFCNFEKTYILWGTENANPYMIEVDSNTVCEYTGLKDDIETEIFENDTISLVYKKESGDKIFIKNVLFVEAMFILASETGFGASLGSYYTQVNKPEFKVIGNLHDNEEE